MYEKSGFVVLGFSAILTAKVISRQSVTNVFLGFLTPVLTQLFFPKPLTTFLTCFCRGERQKYARKKIHLNWGSNSQPWGHESDTLTTEPPGRSMRRVTGVWTWKTDNFPLLQLSNGNFESAVNISYKFDRLSIFKATQLFLRTRRNASLTNQIRWIYSLPLSHKDPSLCRIKILTAHMKVLIV